MTVAEYIVAYLAALGVRHVFGVSGANIEDLYDAAARSGGKVQAVLAKHEFSAATMADGAARSTSGLGVVVSTSGGGALNLVAGLGESYASRIPVLAIVGQVPRHLEGRGGFQDSSGMAGSLDAESLFASVARWCAKANSAHGIQRLLHDAVAASLASPRGPAVLLVPKDVQQASVDESDPFHLRRPAIAQSHAGLRFVRDRNRLATLIDSCRRRCDRVVIIAGAGVGNANARGPLAALAEHLDAIVAVTPDGKDAYDNHSPRFVGVTGVMGHPQVERAVRRARVCLLVGTRMPLVARAGLESALTATHLVSIGDEPLLLEPTAAADNTLELVGDLSAALRWVLANVRPIRCADTKARGVQAADYLPERSLTAGPPSMATYRQVMRALSAAIPSAAHVYVDAGNVGAAAVHYLTTPRDGRFVVALGVGGMGYSFGGAIGAAMSTGVRSYVVAGDGSFYMHGLEVHTAAEYELPVTFIVLNNNAHAMCVAREKLYYDTDATFNRFKPADLGGGIRAMFPSVTVGRATAADDLGQALRAAEATGGPGFVSIDVSADELPPFLPFLQSAPAVADQVKEQPS
jgi:acetolactate synthase I/II/III large subunit